MAEVLSQSEIDELLNALSSGTVPVEEEKPPEEKVRSYDFRSANRFSKEQIRTLQLIFENYARDISTYLSGSLRVMCEAEVLSVEEQKYQEFVNSLPEPVLLAILSMPPLSGTSLFEISPDIAYMMISLLLGGSSKYVESSLQRDFTEIELVLLEKVVRQCIALLKGSWEKVIEISATLDRIETSPQFAQIVALNETIAIITINIKIGGVKGIMNFCIPHLSIQSVSKQFNTKLLFQGPIHPEGQRDDEGVIKHRLETTQLSVSAGFRDTVALFRDINDLAVGDIVQLSHKVNDPVVVKVGHLSKFQGTLGVKKGKMAVKIIDFIREENEEDGQ
ncbi:flagellar motor switch protein FliM [Oscillospiraceae bacterium OttesenSCG-928-G22]|nr:flagellar motor switch protein FliM [Oscillospiraceae bacterium OttesenSCG-928-G22]